MLMKVSRKLWGKLRLISSLLWTSLNGVMKQRNTFTRLVSHYVSPCRPGNVRAVSTRSHRVRAQQHGVSQRITPAGTCWQLASPQRCFHLLTDSACVVLRLLAGWAGAPSLSLSLCSVPAVLIITRSKSRTLSYLHSGTTQMFPRCVFLSLLLLLFCCQPESGSDVVLFTERWQL